MIGPAHTALDLARACGLPDPTPEQQAVIEAPLRPLLVVAGAGSGKTETMAARVVWLVANDLVRADEVLGLTFTRKAAGELGERIGLRLRTLRRTGLWAPPEREDEAGSLADQPTVSTYHSYAARLVGEHALRLGVEPEARLLSEAAAWQVAAEAVARYDGDLAEMDKTESTAIAAVVDLADELAEHLLDIEQVRAELDRVVAAIDTLPPGPGARSAMPAPLRTLRAVMRARRAVLPMVSAYTDLKRSRDALDFADQMALAARLARSFPDIGRIERARYRAVLLDEFQDTSEAQLAVLRDLFVAPGESVPVTAVGDPHQSIYGWRGASASTLARFPHEFAEREEVGAGAPAGVLPLSRSWRNDTAVLRVANAVAEPLRAGSRVAVSPLRARPGAGPGDVEIARLGTQAAEAAYVAAWVKRARARAGTSAAVLCRKRSQFAAIVEALDREGVPREVVGLGGLLLVPEIVDLVALLRVVADPLRGDAVMRLVTGVSCRLGAADLDGLHEWARFRQRIERQVERGELPIELDPAVRDEGEGTDAEPGRLVDLEPDVVDEPSLVEALDDLPPPVWVGRDGQRIGAAALGRLAGLAAAIRRLRGLTGLPLADFVGEVERALGLDVEVLARPEYAPGAARAHLDAFADVADAFSASADRPTLEGFLAWLDAALAEERGLDAGVLEPSPDAVQVLTVHAAKGLEWDVVCVPGLVEGTFPAWEHLGSPTHDGERWVVSDPTPAGWTGGLAGVPYRLRGDADGLPDFAYAAATDLADLERRRQAFRAQESARTVTEERRLAYVALTRSRSRLLLTASVWTGRKSHVVTSRFLEEILSRATELGVRVVEWAAQPGPGDGPDNPTLTQVRRVLWPADPMAARREAARLAEREVAAARAELADREPPGTSRHAGGEPAAADGRAAYERVAVRAGGPTAGTPDPADPYAADVQLLLAERRAARDRPRVPAPVPTHLAASDVVRLAQDPRRFALDLRRPVPAEPTPAARRGTAFHAWVEQHYGRAALLDVLDMPGAGDDHPVGAAGEESELPEMRARFLASEWAQRRPLELELAIETVLAGVAVRGRVDAVFPRPDGGVTVVDWKTGDPPVGEQARHRAVQLGVYALAYARLTGREPGEVDAAFYYVRTGQTIRPELPTERELADVLAALRGRG